MIDLAVIGGGPAGLVIASVASQAGLKVLLAEKSGRLGGDCLHTGCVPSKTLIGMAGAVHAARKAAGFGLLSTMPDVDFTRAMQRVKETVARIQDHDDPERFRGYGCDVRFGEARFSGPGEIMLDGERIRARRFAITTGSIPAIPPVMGLETCGYDTSDTVFSWRELPGRLVILGGGAIGVELAQAFARFGSRVTLVEMADRLLAREDADIMDAARELLESEGVDVITGMRVAVARRTDKERQVQLEDGRTLACDRLLVAAGRRPDVASLGLDAAGIESTRSGISVDRRLRTTQKHIYAAGDVCGPHAFTHAAEYQAGVVIANAVFGLPRKVDYRVMPRVIYTAPEIAAVGLSENEAREQGLRFKTARYSLEHFDRALIDGEARGFVKLLISGGRTVGAAIVAPRAGELVHELALAIKLGVRARELSGLVHAYPSWSQANLRTANQLYAHLLGTRRVRVFSRLMQRLAFW